MKTNEIIDCYCLAIMQSTSKYLFTYNLLKFEEYFSENRNEINDNIDEKSIIDIEFKTDALLRLMNLVSLKVIENKGNQRWDKEYVRSTYGTSIEGCDYIYYPAINPKRLIINFSSMGKDRFDRYSRDWDETQQWNNDTAHLFFKDDDFKYYLGDDENPKSQVYTRIIKHLLIANNLTIDQAFTVGGSMGGYAALYYAMHMGLRGAVVCAPQITKRAMQAHQYKNWIKHANTTGSQWVDLDMLVHCSKKTPFFYIEHGHYDADTIAVESFVNELRKKETITIVRKASWKEHTVDEVLSKTVVKDTILYFEKQFEVNDIY